MSRLKLHKFAPDGLYEVVLLPETHKIVHVGLQDNFLYLWAAVDPETPYTVRYRVWLQGTGSEISEADLAFHVRTEVTAGGYVWHFFVRPDTDGGE